MLVTTVATSLYLYFSSFVPSLPSDCKKKSKVVTWCPENKFCLLGGKNRNKSPVNLFGLNFLHSMLYTILKLSYVLSFFIWVAEVPRKNSFLSAVMFFSASVPVFLLAVLQTLSLLFFFAKTFGQAIETVALPGNLYLQ